MSLRSELNALADQVRRLCGKSGKMTITDMINNLKGVSVGTDASGADAAATDVLSGRKFVGANGTLETGSMTNHDDVSVTLNATTKSYKVPAGYHKGGGSVQVKTQSKSVTPGTSAQTVTPDSGYLLSQVNVAASTGKQVYSGTFTPNNGALSYTLDTGVTLSSEDIFMMIGEVVVAGSINYAVFCAIKNISVNATTILSNGTISSRSNKITFSEKKVTIDGGTYTSSIKFHWYLIKS